MALIAIPVRAVRKNRYSAAVARTAIENVTMSAHCTIVSPMCVSPSARNTGTVRVSSIP
jgi:hypothetical protein